MDHPTKQQRNSPAKSKFPSSSSRKLAGTRPKPHAWLVTDQLGTPRMVFDKTGALATTKRHDYLPFGEELSAGVRSTTPGYGAVDGIRQKFTSQERDNETGLDYMHARYFASAQGRFSSADSVAGSTGNPQSLNRYAYVGNNPMNFSDPTGYDRFSASSNGFAATMGQGSNMSPEDPDNDDPTGLAHRAQAQIDAWIAQEAAEQQAKSGSTGYVGDGIVDTRAGETPADEGKQAPQNSGHEFAHSNVRCPPTGKQLAGNPTVKKAINEAFKRADQFRNERGYWVEHGGWIYQNRKTGRISTFIKTPDASPPLPKNYPYLDYGTGVYLHSPPTRPGSNIVGVFHIHPEDGAPNEYDDAAADNHKVPGVLGTPDGKTYPYGNYQRGIFGEGTPPNCR